MLHNVSENDQEYSSSEDSSQHSDAPVENFRPIKVIVIGAGFSGIYCGVRFPQRIRNLNLTIYEKNEGVGGTWWENRYPGFYAPAAEIRAYLENVVKHYSVDRFLKTSHKVIGCKWNEELDIWEVTVHNLSTGEVFSDEANVVVSARGTLNDIKWPQIAGLGDLSIPVMHSAAWDHSYDFTNKTVGIIGGGSSAIQIIPELQRATGAVLRCFVRSKTWISTPFGDAAVRKLGLTSLEFSNEQKVRFVQDPENYMNFRHIIETEGNSVHALTLRDSPLQHLLRRNFTDMMTQKLSKKPEILQQLLPGFSVACRRLTPGPGYLEALVEDNVDFISTPISRCLGKGVELIDGRKIDLDVLVCATGFNASAPPPFPVVGRNSVTMADRFEPYPETYLSLATDGFPNYFMMLGPNAAIGTGSLTMMIEAAGDYIIKCIRKLQKENIRSMEVKSQRVKDFSSVIDAYFRRTVYLDSCSSWYRSEGGKGMRVTGLWPGSALHAMETFRSPRWEDYCYRHESSRDELQGCNQLQWLGNGWSVAQLEENAGDLAWYLRPEFVDAPAAPFPEATPRYQVRSFSH